MSDENEQAYQWQVEQRVRVVEDVGSIFFGVGEIIAIRDGEALIKWDGMYKGEYWHKFKWLRDAEITS